MELLAPAGNLEKLKWAIAYGADAVYFGTEFGSLRSFAGNFSLEDAHEGIRYLHNKGKKGYVTLNIYPFSEEHEKMIRLAQTLEEMGVDAFIVADMGILMALRRLELNADLFISTQANTTSLQAALAYQALGAKRVNMARELSIEQILAISKEAKEQIDIEVFIHGALCFSYSGRCAISDYLTGFGANRGQCKHPCRWKYVLMEETRPGQYMPVFEDDRGLYLFNCKDLALFEYVPTLQEAGIHSVKIEGRMKSIHYLATVVSFYRQVLDGIVFSKEESLRLLDRVSNRGYTTGFMKKGDEKNDYAWESQSRRSHAVFVGNVLEIPQDGQCTVEVRNKIYEGETLEVLSPGGAISTMVLPEPLMTSDGLAVTSASSPQCVLLQESLAPYAVLRRVEP